MKNCLLFVVALFAGSFWPTLVWGQTFQAGQTVIAVANAGLETLDGSEAKIFPGLPLVIQRIEAGGPGENPAPAQRLLVSNGTPGWISATHVRTPEAALEYIDEMIRTSPEQKVWPTARAMALAASGQNELAVEEFSRLLESAPGDVALLNERAGSYIQQQKYQQAIDDFDLIIASRPEAPFFNNRGLCRQTLGDLEGARADFRKTLELQPRLASAWLSLGKLEVTAGNSEAALKHFSTLIERFPQLPEGYMSRAELYIRGKDFAAALKDYDRLVQMRPDLLTAHANRGLLLRDLGEYQKAFEAFSRIVQQFPDSPVGYINRGLIFEKANQMKEALADFDEALKRMPESGFCWYHRAIAKIGLQDLDAALADLTHAIEIEPKSEAFLKRGEVYALQQKWDLALADYEKTLSETPDNHLARYRRATVLQQLQDNDQALAEYTALVDAGVQSYDVVFNRSQIYVNRRQWSAALADLEQAVKFKAESEHGLNGLAWLLATVPEESLRDPARAIELATQACEISEWKQAMIVDTLAAAHAAAGDFEKAVELEEQAVKLLNGNENPALIARLELFRAGKAFLQ